MYVSIGTPQKKATVITCCSFLSCRTMQRLLLKGMMHWTEILTPKWLRDLSVADFTRIISVNHLFLDGLSIDTKRYQEIPGSQPLRFSCFNPIWVNGIRKECNAQRIYPGWFTRNDASIATISQVGRSW